MRGPREVGTFIHEDGIGRVEVATARVSWRRCQGGTIFKKSRCSMLSAGLWHKNPVPLSLEVEHFSTLQHVRVTASTHCQHMNVCSCSWQHPSGATFLILAGQQDLCQHCSLRLFAKPCIYRNPLMHPGLWLCQREPAGPMFLSVYSQSLALTQDPLLGDGSQPEGLTHVTALHAPAAGCCLVASQLPGSRFALGLSPCP